jgi:hypothetical protein
MTDINSLIERLRKWAESPVPSIVIEVREALKYQEKQIESKNSKIERFMNEISMLKQECDEQCRLNGMGAQREARLLAKLEEEKKKMEKIKALAP